MFGGKMDHLRKRDRELIFNSDTYTGHFQEGKGITLAHVGRDYMSEVNS